MLIALAKRTNTKSRAHWNGCKKMLARHLTTERNLVTAQLGPYLLGPNDTEENGIYVGEALELLQAVPSRSVDVLITDPPYFLPAPGHATKGKEWCGQLGELAMFEHAFTGFFDEFRRILRDTGQLYICCHDRSYPAFYRLAYVRWPKVSLIVWYKPTGRVGRGWRRSHELIMHGASKVTKYTGGFRQDIVGIMPVRTLNRKHPAQKPGDLVAFLLEAVPPSSIVIDPFVGTGTTAAICAQAGFPYLAFEIDAEMAQKAQERLRLTQRPLFVPQLSQLDMSERFVENPTAAR